MTRDWSDSTSFITFYPIRSGQDQLVLPAIFPFSRLLADFGQIGALASLQLFLHSVLLLS